MDYLTTHTSLSPIAREFAPGFVSYKKGCTRLTAASDQVYQLLAHGRWFSPGTPASSTTKTARHDIVKILLKVALSTKIKSSILYIKWFGMWKVDSSLFLLVTCGWIVFYFVDIVIVIIVFINNLKKKFLWFHRLISSISTKIIGQCDVNNIMTRPTFSQLVLSGTLWY